MAEISRIIVLLSNITGARECMFSTLQNNWIQRSLKTASSMRVSCQSKQQVTHFSPLSLPPLPWESFLKKIFLTIKHCESIFLYSRDSKQQHIIQNFVSWEGKRGEGRNIFFPLYHSHLTRDCRIHMTIFNEIKLGWNKIRVSLPLFSQDLFFSKASIKQINSQKEIIISFMIIKYLQTRDKLFK